MNSPDLIVVCLLFWLLNYVSVFWHELGHAVLGRASGYVVTSFGIGMARPLLVRSVAGMRVFLCGSRAHSGLTFALPGRTMPQRWRMVAFLAGGFLFNGGLALASLAVLIGTSWSWGWQFWLALLLTNGGLALGSMVPYRYTVGKAVFRSDGALILLAIRSGTFSPSSVITVQTIAFIEGLARAIGDAPLAQLNLQGGAMSWGDLEDFERAADLLDRARAQPDCGIEPLRRNGEYVRALLAIWMQRPQDAESVLDAAAESARSEGDAFGLLFVSYLRIAARTSSRATAGLGTEIEAIRSNPLVRRRPAFDKMLIFQRLALAIQESDQPAIERWLPEYEALRWRCPSLTTDLKLFRALARFHAGRSDWAAAEPAFRRALGSALELASLWADPAESLRFLERHRSIAEEARQCLQALGKPEEADRLAAPILAPEAAAAAHAETARLRERRLRRRALGMTLANLVSLAALVGIVSKLRTFAPMVPTIVLFVSLIMFTITSAIYLFLGLTLGRLVPGFPLRGQWFLILAWCPWVSVLLALIAQPFLP